MTVPRGLHEIQTIYDVPHDLALSACWSILLPINVYR